MPHVLLPAAAWGEKDGTVTNSERRISRQRSFLPPPGEARPDWWIISEVAARMGFADAFAYQSPAEIFREHAALSGFENDGRRDFDIGACAELSETAYDALEPFQWPRRQGEALDAGTTRFFAEGGFFTSDRRARFVPTPVAVQSVSPDFPLVLNTGRIRDQWHTMTRTAKTPRLMSHYAESFCEIHPDDAEDAGVAPATLVRIVTPQGTVIVRALVTERQQQGSIFVAHALDGPADGAGTHRRGDVSRRSIRSPASPASSSPAPASSRSMPPGTASRCCATGLRRSQRITGRSRRPREAGASSLPAPNRWRIGQISPPI